MYGDLLVAGMEHPPSLLTRISAGEEWDAGGEVPQLPGIELVLVDGAGGVFPQPPLGAGGVIPQRPGLVAR